MSFEEISYLREELAYSKAALAVLNAAEATLERVLEKHPKRKDSWEETFTPFGSCELAGAKVKRVQLLLEVLSAGLSSKEVIDEVLEEIDDAIAYLAFGRWLVGKL